VQNVKGGGLVALGKFCSFSCFSAVPLACG
jgi:hypothetical protein